MVSRHHQRGSVAVAVRALARRRVPPTVLATGDSTMGGIDSFLSDGLANSATLVSEVKPGFAISFGDTWGATAAAQVARLRPAQTVVSIGANEGFAMRAADGARHACCDDAWIGEYARRVRKIMLTYRRQGRGRVFWLTIAAPRDRERAPIFDAVNASIVRAAEELKGVRVLRMDLLFSPHGYQQRIRYRGRDVDVREPDGVHLSVAGTRIAAEVIAAALREP